MWQNWEPSWDCSSFTQGILPTLRISWAPYTACCGRAYLGGGRLFSISTSESHCRRIVSWSTMIPRKNLSSLMMLVSMGVEAVLSHIMPNGNEKPVAYASRTLSAAEKNYSQLDKKGPVIIFGVKKFHQYLLGQTFRIVTDHKSLVSLFSPTRPILDSLPSRIIKWSLLMSSYDYSIIYKPGTNIVAADVMSRPPLYDNLQVLTPGCIIHLMNHLDDTTVNSADICRCTSKDPVLSKVYQALQSGTNLPKRLLYSTFHTKWYELSVENGCLLWGSRVKIPYTLRKVLKELHQCRPGMVKIKALARNYVWWPGMDADIEKKVNRCYTCKGSRTYPTRAPLDPWDGPGNPGTGFTWTMPITTVEICS